MSNEIVLENQKQGNPESEWGLPNGASSSIEGFTTDISTDVGGTVEFKINTDATDYRLDIYRLGYYNGDGARLVGSIEHTGAVNQPAPIVDLDDSNRRCWQLERDRHVDGSRRCGLGRLHCKAGARGRHAR